MQKDLIKVVKYYTLDNPEEQKEKEYSFSKKYTSKQIFDDLSNTTDLFEIESIKTKREVKIVYYTTNKTPLKENKEIFYLNKFSNNKQILDYLIENKDLEFINAIEKDFVIE